MLGLKLNHASKKGLWDYWPHIDVYWNCFLDQWHRFHINDLSSFRVGNIFFTHCWQRLVQTGHAATNIISSYVSLTQLGLVSRICCLKTNLSPTVTYLYSKKFQDDTISINQVKRTLLWTAVLRLIPWIPKVSSCTLHMKYNEMYNKGQSWLPINHTRYQLKSSGEHILEIGVSDRNKHQGNVCSIWRLQTWYWHNVMAPNVILSLSSFTVMKRNLYRNIFLQAHISMYRDQTCSSVIDSMAFRNPYFV